MATVQQQVVVGAPLQTVFDYLADFTQIPTWLFGLESFEPVTEARRGLGAQYDGVLRLGIALTSRVECTVWDEPHYIELASVSGIENTQRWRFTAVDEASTRIEADIEYVLPGGVAGRAVAGAVKPAVGLAVDHSTAALVRNLEAL